MQNNLEVSFNSPQCGWMSIGLSDGLSEFHTTTAHAPHEHALSELLRILNDLLEENSINREYLLQWNRNPEEFDFLFARNGENLLLEIYQYPTGSRETDESEKVFSHRGNTKEVCAAFYQTFAQLYEDRNTDEFEFHWRQPFPYEDFTKFENKIKSYGQ
ncbi:MAG TPA: hypothetical protein VF556_00520 [Pyrinomonadaceae bacterium]|jgi:hypothetical protein